MTHAEALLKLLSLEPETRSRLIAVTGWDAEETEATLDTLVAQGKVTYRNGMHGAQGERRYYPTPATSRRHARALSLATGQSRPGIRNDRSGLVRSERAVASGRLGQADSR